jgi:hypothetical protein
MTLEEMIEAVTKSGYVVSRIDMGACG